MTKTEIEAKVRALCGHRLERVSYTKLGHDDWDDFPDLFDSRVLQIVLDTESGERFFCSWGIEIAIDYGVCVGREPYYDTSVLRPIPGLDGSEALHTVDVSEMSGWSECLHEPIVDVRVRWFEMTSYDVQPNAVAQSRQGEEVVVGEHNLSYSGISESPQELEIVFESGRSIVVCAASYNQDLDTLQVIMDELVVIFRPEVAARYGISRSSPE